MRSVRHDLRRAPVHATDGDLGHLEDLLFDDGGWSVRHLVVDTGDWLPGRRVLLPPQAVERLAPRGRGLWLRVTRAQVEAAPSETTDLPVSRQHETALSSYYGWDPYWTGAGAIDPWAALAGRPGGPEPEPGDPHLRSAKEVIGYHVDATDGGAGQVQDLLLDESSWTVCAVVVRTGHRRARRSTRLDVGRISQIDWLERSVRVDIDRADVEAAPPHRVD